VRKCARPRQRTGCGRSAAGHNPQWRLPYWPSSITAPGVGGLAVPLLGLPFLALILDQGLATSGWGLIAYRRLVGIEGLPVLALL